MNRSARNPLLMTLPFTAGLLTAVLYIGAGRNRTPTQDEDYRKVDLFTHVQTLIENNYLEKVDGWEVLYTGLKSMAELDRYSTFLTPEEGERFNEDTSRQYHGIGFVVRASAPEITVDYLFEGSPAEKSGIRPGDRVLAIEGVPIENFKPGEATQAIKGEEGTLVRLRMQCAADASEREISVARARIARPTVFTDHFVDPEGHIGYARIDSFGHNTLGQLDHALDGMADHGIDQLVLDLRFNEGGLVEVCKEVANRFIEKGDIVGIRYRDAQKNTTHRANPGHCRVPEWPVVVLTNRYTASAAEILAGALQDHKRALLVGQRTFGKGVVQSIYPIPLDGKKRALLKITTGEYLTPAGRAIDSSVRRKENPALGGLEPDVRCFLEKGEEMALARRFRLLEVPARYREQYFAAHEYKLPELKDRQLDIALGVLRGESVVQDL